MTFRPIDLRAYPRREHYERHLDMRVSYSATVQIDITELRRAVKQRAYRIYPAQIWMLTAAANQMPEFRMSRNTAGELGIWDELSPLYTVLNERKQTFSGLWTSWSDNFEMFYHA